jgi:hypothetical protein
MFTWVADGLHRVKSVQTVGNLRLHRLLTGVRRFEGGFHQRTLLL